MKITACAVALAAMFFACEAKAEVAPATDAAVAEVESSGSSGWAARRASRQDKRADRRQGRRAERRAARGCCAAVEEAPQ